MSSYRTYTPEELVAPGFNLNSVILLSDSFTEWVSWSSKVHAYPKLRDSVIPNYQAHYYADELTILQSCGLVVVYSRTLNRYVDFNELLLSTPDLKIVERPERFDTNEEYKEWLNFCGMGDIAPHMKLGVPSYTREAFIRANAVCEYKGGYCHIAFSHKTTGEYFLLYTDYDDDVHNLYTSDLSKAQEIWDHIYNIPDLNSRDVAALGMD